MAGSIASVRTSTSLPHPAIKENTTDFKEPTSGEPEFYDKFYDGLGEVRFHNTGQKDERTKQSIYVPEFISAINEENSNVIEHLPVALKRIWYGPIKRTEPYALTPFGVVNLSKAQRWLNNGRYRPTLDLPSHPLVPQKEDGTVDVLAIFEMQREIAKYQCDVSVDPSMTCKDKCCGRAVEQETSYDFDERLRTNSESWSKKTSLGVTTSP